MIKVLKKLENMQLDKFKVGLLFLISFSMCSFSSDIKGYWVDTEQGVVAEFADDNVIFTSLVHERNHYVYECETISDNRFELKRKISNSKYSKHTKIVFANWKTGLLRVDDMGTRIEGVKGELEFKRAPKLTLSDVVGTWYSSEKTDDFESSTIIRQREESYDYESVIVVHNKKEYNKDISLDLESRFENGFIWVQKDKETKETFYSYITSFQDNKIEYLASFNTQWSELKVDNPKHVVIPKGYTVNKDL